MEWTIWITWWIIFFTRCSRLIWIYLKKHGEKINNNNPSLKIYVNKLENRITFKIKTECYLELLKQWNYLEALKVRQKKDENRENVPHLETTKVVLIHFNIVNNNYQ